MKGKNILRPLETYELCEKCGNRFVGKCDECSTYDVLNSKLHEIIGEMNTCCPNRSAMEDASTARLRWNALKGDLRAVKRLIAAGAEVRGAEKELLDAVSNCIDPEDVENIFNGAVLFGLPRSYIRKEQS